MNSTRFRFPAALAAVTAITLALFCSGGCSDSQDYETETNAETVSEQVQTTLPELTAAEKALAEKAATIANAIEKAPETAEAILKSFDLSSEEFEAMMYKIAAKPALSAAYEEARQAK